MVNTYPKATGSAGFKGVDFQINLMTIFLLNALKQNIKNWKLSTEHKLAGKFDDVVLELSDGSAILLQAKHKENRKISLDQILSTNSKNENFSLPKFFLSYLEIRAKFLVKFVIICTNTKVDEKTLGFLNRSSVGRASMLHCKDGASFFTFTHDIVPDLITNTRVYLENNLKDKGVLETMITEENAKKFLGHLQLYLDYPSGSHLEKAIGKLLSGFKSPGNLLYNIPYPDLYQKMKDWFEHPKGEYLTESGVLEMFCQIKSEKYRESLQHYKVCFKNNDFKIAVSAKRIFHVVAEGGHLMHLLKIDRALQLRETNVLYAFPDNGADVQYQLIKTFKLPLYTYLVIISPKFSRHSLTQVCQTIIDLLQSSKRKKVIFVAERCNRLVEQIKSAGNDYEIFHEPLTLTHLSEDSQEMLLKQKNIKFQGEDVSLEELLAEVDDQKESIKLETLEKLVRNEKIKVGTRLKDLDEDVSRYYIDRRFERIIKEDKAVKKKKEPLSEEDICSIEEKIILISDSAGMGKTTVLKNLAIAIKDENPLLWVVTIELNDCTKFLKNSLKNGKSVSVWELLHCREVSKLTNELESVLFFTREKVILMLDGVDEISPDYEDLILHLLLRSQKEDNLKKIFLTTRSHGAQTLTTHLNVTSLKLVPLTKQNQIDFFTRYWTYTLKLESGSISKCERYAKTLLSRVCSWIREWYSEVEFVASPLHAKMLAEIFLENRESEEWQGCKEYLSADETDPKLPERMNIAKLYEMFIEKKRDIFMDKGNPSGNTTANQALMDQFKECLAYHKSPALKAILNERNCPHFSSYQVSEIPPKVLKMGIVQNLDGKLSFVHRTFAEYFVADSILEELQLLNENVEFQKFLIDTVFFDDDYNIIRHFLDNLLHNRKLPLSCDIFRHYKLLVQEFYHFNLIHRLALEGRTEIIRLVLKCIHFKVVRGRESSVYYWRSVPAKRNTLNILQYLAGFGGINIRDNKGWMPLHHAVYGGHLDTVKFMVEMGADVNDNAGLLGNALHKAAKNGNCEVAEFLLQYVTDINTTNIKGYTALHIAAEKSSFGIVELLVKHNADINVKNEHGYTALHFAVRSDSSDIVAFLLKHDVDANDVNEEGCTALHFAANDSNFDIAVLLLKAGAHVNTENKEGNTALHFAANSGSFHIFELLVEHSADIHIANKEGNTALHVAAGTDSLDIVRLLVKHGANVDATNQGGYTALHFASQHNSVSIIQFLVEHGANINITNWDCYTALHFAVEKGNCSIVELLLKHGADINIANGKGYTALHFATDMGSCDIAELLVKHNADINIASEQGYTALHLAAEKGNVDIVQFLVRNHANVDIGNEEGYAALHFASLISSFEIIQFLVRRGADINIATRAGCTALHFAVNLGRYNVLKFLVRRRADINIKNKEGHTALHFAVQRDNFNIVRYLVQHGANINIVDVDGGTALHLAAQRDNSDIFKFLVKRGADVNIADKEGRTALHLASDRGSFKIIEFLITREVNINLADEQGRSALHLAVERDNIDIAKLLVKHGADIDTTDKEGHTALSLATQKGFLNIVKLLN